MITEENCRRIFKTFLRGGTSHKQQIVHFFVLIPIEIRIQEFLTEFLPPPDGDNYIRISRAQLQPWLRSPCARFYILYTVRLWLRGKVPELQRSRVMILILVHDENVDCVRVHTQATSQIDW